MAASRATGVRSRRAGAAAAKARIRVADASPEFKLGLLAQALAFRLRYASGVAHQAFADHFAPAGFVPREYSVLSLIASNPGTNVKALAQAIGVDSPSLIAPLDSLEAKGWIERGRARPDRRVASLHITEAGQARLHDIERAVMAHDAFVTAQLSEQEKSALVSALDKVVAACTGGAGSAILTKK